MAKVILQYAASPPAKGLYAGCSARASLRKRCCLEPTAVHGFLSERMYTIEPGLAGANASYL